MKVIAAGWTIIFITILTFLNCRTNPEKIQGNKIIDDPLAREQYLEWFREAKFGLFIHWGPYSELAGEWNGRQ